MKLIAVISLLLILFSCIDEAELRPVVPEQLINSNSAKSWVKTGHILGNKNSAPRLNELRETYTFYYDGTFRKQQMIHLGSSKGRVGRYNLGITKKVQDTFLRLYFNHAEDIEFQIKHIDSRNLILEKDSITWVLETLEPPNVK